MITLKQYNLDEKYIDIVAVFDRPEQNFSEGNEQLGSNDYRKDKGYWEGLTQEQKDIYNKQRSIQRTKTKVRRLVISQKLKYMWTLTFDTQIQTVKGKEYNTGELDDVWTIWKAFVKRCQRAGVNMHYVVTVEVQEKRLAKYGEKVYHFHFATDKYIPWNKEIADKKGMDYDIQTLWGHGNALVSSNKRQGKFAHLYLMKYITKMFDETEQGSHRYRCSRGMVVEFTTKKMESEAMLDLYVNQLAKRKGCSLMKEYYPINDGAIEVLVYILVPYTNNIKGGKKNVRSKNNFKSTGEISS